MGTCDQAAPTRARVLVMDGDPAVRRSIEDLLRSAGIDAVVAVRDAPSAEIVALGECSVDLASAQLLRPDAAVRLARGEMALLRCLSSPRGAWRTTEDLARAIGRKDAAGLGLVWKYISRIKTKLGTAASMLEHVRNVGYRLR